MIEVTLSRADLDWARDIGRQRIAMAPGNPRFAYKEGRSGLDTHTIGCMGELAASRVFGVEWPARVNTFRSQPDLDPFWEVRWSSNPNRVKIAKDDPPENIVLHVTGSPPTFFVVGYVRAGWAQEHRPLEDPGERGWAAHFARVDQLAPVDLGFHDACHWMKWEEEWLCIFCGNRDPSAVRA